MVDFIRLAEQVAINKLLQSDMPFIGRTAGEEILLMLFGVFVTLGFLFLIFGFYLWLQATQTPQVAAFVTGGAALLLAVILGGVQLVILWLKARKIRQTKQVVEDVLREIVSSANDEIGATVHDNPKTSALVALVLGLLVGDRVL